MDGGAWPFLVRGVICLLDCDNGRDLVWMLLGVMHFVLCLGSSATAVCVLTRGSSRLKQVCDALRCSGPHARYNGRDNKSGARRLVSSVLLPGLKRLGKLVVPSVTGIDLCNYGS